MSKTPLIWHQRCLRHRQCQISGVRDAADAKSAVSLAELTQIRQTTNFKFYCHI
jgi:hypothetical protein